MLPLKFIADVNIEKPVIDYLRNTGYDVKWLPDYNCELPDQDLLGLANAEKRILITNDKDFGELTFLQRKASTGIILFRVKGQKSGDKLILMKKLMTLHSNRLLHHFTVVTRKKIRIIPLEDRYAR